MQHSTTDASSSHAQPMMKRLKQATQSSHAQLEALPYFQALMAHRLPLDCYLAQLNALAVIHGVLEAEIAAADDQRLQAVWHDDLRKLPLLQADLRFFEPRATGDAPAAVQSALAMTAKIRLRRVDQPLTLLGYLYVFEGSTLGNRMHQPDIAATFNLGTGEGCRYYASYTEQVADRWQDFSETMNRVLDDPSDHAPVLAAAREAFAGLEALYGCLYPLEGQDRSPHITRINPEAGNHPMPDDKREIQAALTASGDAWRQFGYYEQRYGDRGRRFADSSTCWLATLTRLEPASMHQEVHWLGRVLATRGMPRIMLETTLRCLHQALVQAVPDQSATYGRLLEAVERLERDRQQIISEAQCERLSRAFDQAIGPDRAAQWTNTGRLLVSAVTDETAGIAGTVAAVTDWLVDKDRIPTVWIEAVNETIAAARQMAAYNSPIVKERD